MRKWCRKWTWNDRLQSTNRNCEINGYKSSTSCQLKLPRACCGSHTRYQRSNLLFLHSWHADSHILALHLLIKRWRLWGARRDVWTAHLISLIWKRPIATTGLLKARGFTFVNGWKGRQLQRGKKMSSEKPQITINLGRKKKIIEIGKWPTTLWFIT